MTKITTTDDIMFEVQHLVARALQAVDLSPQAKDEWRQVPGKLKSQTDAVSPGIVADWVDGEEPPIPRLVLTSERVATLKFELGFALNGTGRPVTRFSFTAPHGAGTASPSSVSFLDQGLTGLGEFMLAHHGGNVPGNLLG